MIEPVLQPPIWRTVAQETSRYWLRRHRSLITGVCAAALVATLMAVAGHFDEARSVLAATVFYAPFIAGLMAMSGIVSDDRESGLIVLWLQKPGTLFRVYAVRYALYQALLAACAASLALVLGLIGASTNLFTLSKAVRLGLVIVSVTMIAAAMVFAFSAWGARRDSTVAFFVTVLGVSLAGITAFDRSTLADVLKLAAFPIDSLMAIAGGDAYSSNLVRPVTIVLAQFAVWSGLGLVGLKYTERVLHRSG